MAGSIGYNQPSRTAVKQTTVDIAVAATGFALSSSVQYVAKDSKPWHDGWVYDEGYLDTTYGEYTFDGIKGYKYYRTNSDGSVTYQYRLTNKVRVGQSFYRYSYSSITYTWGNTTATTDPTSSTGPTTASASKTLTYGIESGKKNTVTIKVSAKASYTRHTGTAYGTYSDYTYYLWTRKDGAWVGESGTVQSYSPPTIPDTLSASSATYPTSTGTSGSTSLGSASNIVTVYAQGDEFEFNATKTDKVKDILKASNILDWGNACAAKHSWYLQKDAYSWCDDCKTVSSGGRITASWYNKCRNCVESITSNTRATTEYAKAGETIITTDRINALDILYS